MAKKGKRKVIGLVCEETGDRLHYTTKNTQTNTEKIRLRKYNSKLRRHTWFVETKKNLGRNEVKPRK